MAGFEIRDYRCRVAGRGLVPFRVVLHESDLLVLAERDLSAETMRLLRETRGELERYLRGHPEFLSALSPLPEDPEAPPLVRRMLRAGARAGVGPMAAVAGAIAEAVGREIVARGLSREVVVENGGDVYLHLSREATVGLWAGKSPLSGRLGLRVPRRLMPCAVCTSSGTVGHSLSLGRADAVCVLAREAALADALATALGNLVRGPEDFARLSAAARAWGEILGLVCVVGERLLALGPELELVPLRDGGRRDQ